MATTTTVHQLRKPDSADLVNVLTDIATNMDRLEKVPRGEVAYNQVTASVSGFTTDTDLVTAPAYTFRVGRRYKITAKMYTNSTVAGDTVAGVIKEGTTEHHLFITDGGFKSMNLVHRFEQTGADASRIFKLTARRNTGTGTITNNAGGNIPTFILIEDMGAA